jgi:hypothetical protein
MYYPCEMILKNYIPETITSEMFFVTRNSSGENVNSPHIWKFESYMTLEEYSLQEIFDNIGYPVELYIIDPKDEEILVWPNQIGWFDDGESSDEYRDIELKDINSILENEGLLEIEISNGTTAPIFHEDIIPILEEDKVIIRML